MIMRQKKPFKTKETDGLAWRFPSNRARIVCFLKFYLSLHLHELQFRAQETRAIKSMKVLASPAQLSLGIRGEVGWDVWANMLTTVNNISFPF